MFPAMRRVAYVILLAALFGAGWFLMVCGLDSWLKGARGAYLAVVGGWMAGFAIVALVEEAVAGRPKETEPRPVPKVLASPHSSRLAPPSGADRQPQRRHDQPCVAYKEASAEQ